MVSRSLTLLLLFLSLATSAQPLASFGEPIPLSNTRYIPVRELTSDFFAPPAPLLRTNGTDAFVFLADDTNVRVARVGETPRIARVVFPFAISSQRNIDAVWTGSHFLVVAIDRQDFQIWGRLVNGAGEPAGEPFLLGSGIFPALAFNGRYVLLIHGEGLGNVSRVLLPNGTPAGFAPQDLPNPLSTGRPAATSNGSRFAAVIPPGSQGGASVVFFDENGQITSQQMIADELLWEITSDGNRFLVVSARGYGSALWLFNADGTLQTTRDLIDADKLRFYRDPLVIWSGSWWVVSRVADDEGQVLELDPDAKEIVSTSWVPNTQVAIGVVDGTVIGAWWSNREVAFGTFPFTTGRSPVVREAAAQYFTGTATSRHSTLFLWNELDGLRAGVRTVDGRWRERVIGPGAYAAIAASDGNEFVVIARDQVIRLDASGEVIATSTPVVPFLAVSIAWNGTRYGVIGVDAEGRIVTATLTAGGLSAPVRLPVSEPIARVIVSASEGRFFAAWSVVECLVHCTYERIDGVVLNVLMEPVGAVETLSEGDPIYGAFDLAWNGARHVLAYATNSVIRTREIDRDGNLSERRNIWPEAASLIHVVPAQDGVIVGWANPAGTAYRAMSLSRSGVLSEPVVVHEEPYQPDWGGQLTRLADGRLAFAFASPQPAAPHHGSPHLMLSISDAVPVAVPGPPRASLQSNRLSWTRPDGAVVGYRVEQRTGDDDWIEIDRWFDADELSFDLPAVPDAATSFRVRAFSDGGAGDYSAPARQTNRRRAVR